MVWWGWKQLHLINFPSESMVSIRDSDSILRVCDATESQVVSAAEELSLSSDSFVMWLWTDEVRERSPSLLIVEWETTKSSTGDECRESSVFCIRFFVCDLTVSSIGRPSFVRNWNSPSAFWLVLGNKKVIELMFGVSQREIIWEKLVRFCNFYLFPLPSCVNDANFLL